VLSARPLERLETEVSQPGPNDQAPIKTWDTKAQVKFSGWQFSLSTITGPREVNAIHDSTGRGKLEDSHLELSGLCPMHFFPRLTNLFPNTVTNSIREYNSFQ